MLKYSIAQPREKSKKDARARGRGPVLLGLRHNSMEGKTHLMESAYLSTIYTYYTMLWLTITSLNMGSSIAAIMLPGACYYDWGNALPGV